MNWKNLGNGALSSLSTGLIGGAVNGFMDRIFNGSPSKQLDRQLAYNRQLMDYQQQLNREQFDYEYEKQSPKAIREQLEKAGLNPALMYGGSSASGIQASIDGVGLSSLSNPHVSAQGTANPLAISQLQVMDAQAKDLEASANLKNAEAKDLGFKVDNLNPIQKQAMELDNQLKRIGIEETRVGIAIKQLSYDIAKATEDSTIDGIKASNDNLKYQGNLLLAQVETEKSRGRLTEQEAKLAYENTCNAVAQRTILQIQARAMAVGIELSQAQIQSTLAQAGLFQKQGVLINAETLTEYAKTRGIRIENERALKAAKYDGYNNAVGAIRNTLGAVGDLVDIGVSVVAASNPATAAIASHGKTTTLVDSQNKPISWESW